MRFKNVLACSTFITIGFCAELSMAGASNTSSVACGSSQVQWNAPNGALVLSRARGGMISPTLSAIGEYYSHSMISHGGSGWVTHSTMFTPGTTGWPTFCSTPLKANELKSGYPGASQTNQGGIYTFLYGGGEGVEGIHFQRSVSSGAYNDHGLDIANYLWNALPYDSTYSKSDGGQIIYRLKHHGNLTPMPYVLYQYRTSERINEGVAAWNNGSVCSTFIAYAHFLAGKGTIDSYTYDHTKTVEAGNALYNTIESECNSGTGFWKDAGVAITCFEGICDDAARQARNCMARGICDSDDSGHWDAVKNDSNAKSTSISPDRLGGWGGHPWSGSGVSVWAEDMGEDVLWNSPGNVYGCWF